ncbi:metallophosphoesterase [Legionella hackeliae]|nr:metallophosphoesterase [Legionella hackeliae]
MRLLFSLMTLLFPLVSQADAVHQENNFLVLSDIHLDLASTRPMDITPSKYNGNNDLDYATFERLISEIDNNIKNGTVAPPEFILILGDIVGHTRSTSESAAESEVVVFRMLKDTFPNTPIFYTFGNNDSLKSNYGPFKDDTRDYKTPYDIAKYAGWINGFLSTGVACQKSDSYPCLINEEVSYGYYSAYLKPQLRLISLNTVQFSPNRKTTQHDALNQLTWLESQLKIAAAQQETVLLSMHIPPGNNMVDHSNFWLSKEQTAFLKLINRYQKTIVGLLASHTHTEELRVIKDSSQNTIAGVYFVPGLSTSHGNEPSIKTFYLANKDERWQLSNYEVFHFSELSSNLLFSKLYDYANYYCNPQETGLLACLGNVTVDKIDKYFAAGNRNYTGGMLHSPSDMVLIASE